MPNKCDLSCNGAKHAFHFPKDFALFNKWSTFVTDINKDWHYSNHSVLCERHFEPRYFVDIMKYPLMKVVCTVIVLIVGGGGYFPKMHIFLPQPAYYDPLFMKIDPFANPPPSYFVPPKICNTQATKPLNVIDCKDQNALQTSKIYVNGRFRH